MLETLNVTKLIEVDSDKTLQAIASIGGSTAGFRSSLIAASRARELAR